MPNANSGAPSESYPRPTLRRSWWMCLNGPWDFSLDPDGAWALPEDAQWKTTILVPFSPETPASGVGDTGFYRACWYRRQFEMPAGQPTARAFWRGGLSHACLGERA